MKQSMKCLKVGLSSFVVTGMLVLPTGVFATDEGGNHDSKLGEVIHQVETKIDNGKDSDEVKAKDSDEMKAHAKADLVVVTPMAGKVNGKLQFQCVNNGSESVTMKYAVKGSNEKKEVTLAPKESKVIEIDSAEAALIDLWVNEIAKASVKAYTAATASVQNKADLVFVKALAAKADGKIRFQFENRNNEPITVKYAWVGSDLKQDVTLGANEKRVIELDSDGKTSLGLWINEVAKAPVASIAATISPQTQADSVIVVALPVKEVGKIRYQLQNSNGSPVTVKYALAGSDLKKEVDLAPNETAIIEIETAKDKASLDLWVNEVPKTPVEANIDLTVLNPNLNLGNDTGTNPGTDTGSTPGNGTGSTPSSGTGSSPDTGAVGGVSTGGNTDNGSTPVVTPDSQNAAAGANGNQPGSGTLVAGVSDSPGAVAGYDQLPQTGEQVPWMNYLVGSVLVLLGAVTLSKLRRRTQ
jgi:LPXTG-motif cell wall-anchored protein